MRKILKIGFIGAGAFLILVAAAILLLGSRLDSVAKTGVERALSYVYGTNVTVDTIAIAPLRRTIEAHELTIWNPPPFKEKPAIRFKRIQLRFDLQTLFAESPTIEQIDIEGAHVYLHYKVGEGTNLAKMGEHADELAGDDDTPPEPANGKEPIGVRKGVIIEKFTCRKSTIHFSTNLVPKSSVSIDLDPFEITAIGPRQTRRPAPYRRHLHAKPPHRNPHRQRPPQPPRLPPPRRNPGPVVTPSGNWNGTLLEPILKTLRKS